MLDYEIKPTLKKILKKLFKKDRIAYEYIFNRINEVINSKNIEHYKNLRYDMKKFKAIHIDSFVLIFNFDKENNLVSFENYDPHDNIYKK